MSTVQQEVALPLPHERVKFLEHIRRNPACGIGDAARVASSTRKQFKMLQQSDPEFAEDYREARGYGDEAIRAEIRRRALEGWEEPVFGSLGPGAGSGEIGRVRKFSDRLLVKLAEAHLPEFKDARRLELTGADGGPVAVEGRLVVGIGDVFRLAS